jgi:hypothetical protein
MALFENVGGKVSITPIPVSYFRFYSFIPKKYSILLILSDYGKSKVNFILQQA